MTNTHLLPEVVVIDYANQPRRRPEPPTSEYVPRLTRRQKAIERQQRGKLNRKRWHETHEVELNETKRLLYKALRLLRKTKVKLPQDMAKVLARHEAEVAARAERTRAMRKKFEVKPA